MWHKHLQAMALIGLAAILGGCSPSGQSGTRHGGTEGAASHEAAPGPQENIPEGLAELSPEDRAAALAQRVCPVSKEPLGSMGPPVKVTVQGRTVFLCCAACEDELRENPDKFLAESGASEGD